MIEAGKESVNGGKRGIKFVRMLCFLKNWKFVRLWLYPTNLSREHLALVNKMLKGNVALFKVDGWASPVIVFEVKNNKKNRKKREHMEDKWWVE